MERNRVEIPYDSEAERALTRVSLMRAGVPRRVLDAQLPEGRAAAARIARVKKRSSLRTI